MIKNFKGLFENMSTGLLNFFTLASFLVAVPIPLLKALIKYYNDSSINLFFEWSRISSVPAIIAIIILCVRVYVYRKNQQKVRKALSSGYHKTLRNYKNMKEDIANHMEKEKMNTELLTRIVNSFCKESLDDIFSIFQALTGKECSSCIKTIEKTDDEREYVETFIRSSNTKISRNKNDEINIIDYIDKNTDFDEIVNKKKDYFYCGDLIKLNDNLKKKDERYENTHPDWKEHYRAVIVIPIRIANSYNGETAEEKEYTIIGFLCIDSMSTKAFTEAQEIYYVEFAKAYAELFFSVLFDYSKNLKRINEWEK